MALASIWSLTLGVAREQAADLRKRADSHASVWVSGPRRRARQRPRRRPRQSSPPGNWAFTAGSPHVGPWSAGERATGPGHQRPASCSRCGRPTAHNRWEQAPLRAGRSIRFQSSGQPVGPRRVGQRPNGPPNRRERVVGDGDGAVGRARASVVDQPQPQGVEDAPQHRFRRVRQVIQPRDGKVVQHRRLRKALPSGSSRSSNWWTSRAFLRSISSTARRSDAACSPGPSRASGWPSPARRGGVPGARDRGPARPGTGGCPPATYPHGPTRSSRGRSAPPSTTTAAPSRWRGSPTSWSPTSASRPSEGRRRSWRSSSAHCLRSAPPPDQSNGRPGGNVAGRGPRPSGVNVVRHLRRRPQRRCRRFVGVTWVQRAIAKGDASRRDSGEDRTAFPNAPRGLTLSQLPLNHHAPRQFTVPNTEGDKRNTHLGVVGRWVTC